MRGQDIPDSLERSPCRRNDRTSDRPKPSLKKNILPTTKNAAERLSQQRGFALFQSEPSGSLTARAFRNMRSAFSISEEEAVIG